MEFHESIDVLFQTVTFNWRVTVNPEAAPEVRSGAPLQASK